ncbi:MAG: DUF1036 domain-containing protein [Bosea sp. (in: a-proteobacteria)]
MLPKIFTLRFCSALFLTAVAGLSLPGHANAQASNSAAAQAYTDLTFCNNTAKKVYIAIVYYEVRTQKWMQSAWYNRNPGECKSNGKYRSGLTYYHAYNEGRTSTWPSTAKINKTFCVPAGRVERVQLGGNCAAGERNVGFHGINATGATYKFTLN